MTQEQRILRHLQDHKTITPAEAYMEYGVYRLSAVIFELRKTHIIKTDIIQNKNRYGEKVKYALYTLQ